MAFELFLSKKLNKAEENDWLLHNEKGEHESFSNGYLVEKNQERSNQINEPCEIKFRFSLNEFNPDGDNSMVTQYDEVSESKSFRAMNESKKHGCKCTSEVKAPIKFHQTDALDYDGDEEANEAYSHCHDYASGRNSAIEAREKKENAKRKLIMASIICTCFMTAEIIGGVLSHSIAILSDACHMFTDLSSFILSLIAIQLSSKKPTAAYNFGYSRIEIIVAIFNVLFIWIITAALVMEAVERVREPDEFAIDGKVMLIVSSLAVFFNLTLGMTLHDHGHSHGSHGHSHGDSGHGHSHASESGRDTPKSGHSGFSLTSIAESTKSQDINIRAAMVHVIGDLLQSIGVFIASVLIYLKPEWKIADPICTFIFSIFVICTTIPIMRDTIKILMHAAPSHINRAEMIESMMQIKGVLMVHEMKIWTLTNDKTVVTCHLAIGTKQALSLDEEMEKMRLEKSKRRSSLKPTLDEPHTDKIDCTRHTAIKQLMSENKELLARCDKTLKRQLDLALETESDQLSAARDELDKTLERSRELLAEMDDGTLTENEELHEIRARLIKRRQSAPASSATTTSSTNDNESPSNDEIEPEIKSEKDFILRQRLHQLEVDIERGRKLLEEREAKRNAFLKKQNKHYCQLMWKQLADENNKE